MGYKPFILQQPIISRQVIKNNKIHTINMKTPNILKQIKLTWFVLLIQPLNPIQWKPWSHLHLQPASSSAECFPVSLIKRDLLGISASKPIFNLSLYDSFGRANFVYCF